MRMIKISKHAYLRLLGLTSISYRARYVSNRLKTLFKREEEVLVAGLPYLWLLLISPKSNHLTGIQMWLGLLMSDVPSKTTLFKSNLMRRIRRDKLRLPKILKHRQQICRVYRLSLKRWRIRFQVKNLIGHRHNR